MMRKWFRVRYQSEGLDLQSALRLLDRLAQQSLEILWIQRRSYPSLLVSTSPDNEAVLVEGLINVLPEARINRERDEDVAHILAKKPQYTLICDTNSQVLPAVLNDIGNSSLHMTWTNGKLTLRLTCNTPKKQLDQTLRKHWPGSRIPLFNFRLGNQEARPSQVMTLPSSRNLPTLASRNISELEFKKPHPDGLLIGSDKHGTSVHVPLPARAIWVGDGQRVNNVCTWVSQRWPGRVLVLDGSALDPSWHDVSQAEVIVNWSASGRSSHVNPLDRISADTDVPQNYVNRIMNWLKILGLNQTLGNEIVELVRLAMTLLVASGEVLTPAHMLQFLQSPRAVLESVDPWASEVFDRDEMKTWQTKDWHRHRALLSPALANLRSIFDQVPEMALWLPTYTPADKLMTSTWSIIRVPVRNKGQRTYWSAILPLLRATLDSSVLVFSLQLGPIASQVLRLGTQISVLTWGRNLYEATGYNELGQVPGGGDLLIGSNVDPQLFGRQLNVPPMVLSSQANDQAVARIGTDIGSVNLHISQSEVMQAAGWSTAGGKTIPPLVSVLGDSQPAQAIVSTLAEQAVNDGHRLLILGTRDVWPQLKQRIPKIMCLPATDIPMLNPFDPRPHTAFPWIWWGTGLRIPAQVLQEAFRAKITTLQHFYSFVQQIATYPQVETELRQAIQTDHFGVAESNPAEWFEIEPVIAVESVNNALTRTLAMGALQAGARIIAWDAPGFFNSDINFLQRTHGLIYPDELWINQVLVVRVTNGLVSVLPDALQAAVGSMTNGEAYLLRRGVNKYAKVQIGSH